MDEDYCEMCEGFGYYPLGRMNVHMCWGCKGSGFRAGFISFLPWDHPAIRMWLEIKPPDQVINMRQIMCLPRPVYVPEIHGPDAMPRMRKTT